MQSMATLAKTPKQRRREAATRKPKIIKRAKYRCEICRWGSRQYGECVLNVHHIRAVSRGGHSGGTNLIALCPNCHGLIHMFQQVKRLFRVDQTSYFIEEVRTAMVREFGYSGSAVESMILILTEDVQVNKRGLLMVLGSPEDTKNVGELMTNEKTNSAFQGA